MTHDHGHMSEANSEDFFPWVGGRIAECYTCHSTTHICAYCNNPIPLGKVRYLPPPMGGDTNMYKTLLHELCLDAIVKMVRSLVGLDSTEGVFHYHGFGSLKEGNSV
jgi:hypothetical protein